MKIGLLVDEGRAGTRIPGRDASPELSWIVAAYEVWARATDSAGVMQPHAIDWNPKGYLNNTMHRVALRVS